MKRAVEEVFFFLAEECAVNGKYISLMNHSTNKDIDISRWMLKRHIDAAPEIRYRIPDGVRLPRGKELRIYSKLGAESTNQSAVSSLVQQQIVNNDVATWGMSMRDCVCKTDLLICLFLLVLSRYR
jgi:hypothetical protein